MEISAVIILETKMEIKMETIWEIIIVISMDLIQG
jgi:hypothetical protein